MFKESLLDKLLRRIKNFIPKSVFDSLAPHYHRFLSWSGAAFYRFPSSKIRVIGVTGTKGKSSVVYMTTKLLEGAGHNVAAIGSLGYKIKDKEWPNLLKMTMPGRWKMHKFIRQAVNAGCTHAVIEAPSEGLAQGRHLGIDFDCAVYTGIHPEHIEAHGSFENYRRAKKILFEVCRNYHVINADDAEHEFFGSVPAQKKIFYGIESGDLRASELDVHADRASFTVYGTRFDLKLGGKFNVYNALAALSVGALYGIDLPAAKPSIERIAEIPGRLQWVQKEPFGVVVDYAHTPDSLRAVYDALRPQAKKLICVLGAAGGGRDRWKRKEFGKIAEDHCDAIILTDEDPFDEDPMKILADIKDGITSEDKVQVILDRREAIAHALNSAKNGDIVVITGKGSETSMALAGGRKIPWSDAQVVRGLLNK